MEGCPGCFASIKGQLEQFEKVKSEAAAYAKENNKAMAIYKEGDEFKFIDAFDAYARNLGPAIREVVSAYH